jgi:phosphoenolpyruvate carboxykinase (diphosphate)
MDVSKSIGTNYKDYNRKMESRDLIRYINLKLAAMGFPFYEGPAGTRTENASVQNKPNGMSDPQNGRSMEDRTIGQYLSDWEFINLTENIILDYQEKSRLLTGYACPADQRINTFLNRYLKGCGYEGELNVPNKTLILDQYGLAREISLPPDCNEFKNKYISSYRIQQGILHNPLHDRRTTKGTFHIVADGLPTPVDKKEVPRITFAHLFHAAVNPPDELKILPFTSTQREQAKLFASLLLRPIVSPEVPGVMHEKTMEIRFFTPGSLVCLLDFVESIFGNAGDPTLPLNDAGLDTEHWTGHTGCIIIAPHLTQLKKRDVGLPPIDQATEREKRDGMCYEDEDELYNDGVPFKCTCRDADGVCITLIADNYFGYSKKEVKTQLSYAANLYGICEEEHAGGTIAYPRQSLGEFFSPQEIVMDRDHCFEEVKNMYGKIMDVKEENYGIDKQNPQVIYIPENAEINLYKTSIKWKYAGKEHAIKLLPNHYYIYPTGYKVHMQKHPATPAWRLIGTEAEGMFCHKPCTVSGGGKSEISKSLQNAIIYGFLYVNDFENDCKLADEIIHYDYRRRWKSDPDRSRPSRPFLSEERTLGSAIKLLTPHADHTDEYLDFLASIPNHVKALVLFIKRFYRAEWGNNWRQFFSVDIINGRQGNSVLYKNRKIMAGYLRVGFHTDSSWYVHKVRTDFIPAAKIQTEDDISATITLPASKLEHLNPEYKNESVKLVINCEYRFFQRPDEAIHRGYDKQAEADLARKNTFTTNYQPLTPEDGWDLIHDAIGFEEYTEPIKNIIRQGADGETGSYFISPSHTRIIEDGSRSKNPRYLQLRPDFVEPLEYYVADMGVRLKRKVPPYKPVYNPVNAVLPGRRNNPPNKEKKIRALSVYNPIHYQELPELFMDFVCSLTGKSPSTTGAGSEGALTKGPFNMLVPTSDLNNALVSYILTGYNGFSSAAGHVGKHNRFDHDISILIPELWSRMRDFERDVSQMIADGSLEKLEDFEYEGQTVLASRLGYRITRSFLFRQFGKVFDEPSAVFTDEMLKPELQDMEAYVDGVNNIVEAQKRVALQYFEDGSIEFAIPPLKALLHIMAYGTYEGKTVSDPEIRSLFSRDYLLNSEWYWERLSIRQKRDTRIWETQIAYIKEFKSQPINQPIVEELRLEEKCENASLHLEYVKSERYLQSLVGTIGADPLFRGRNYDGDYA